jgi:rhodanese-related sulfurtransferase
MQSPKSRDQELSTALYKTGIKIIDIRTKREWKRTGIVKGSYIMTFYNEKGQYDAEKFVRKLKKIVNPQEPFGIICNSGNRTARVVKFLRQAGFSQAIDLKGGVIAAARHNVPFERYTN